MDQITPDQGKLGHKGAQAVRDRLLALKKQGNSLPFDTYSKMSSHKDKLEFGLKLKLDPEGAFCMVEESSGVSAGNRQSRVHGWMAKWEFANIMGIKYDPKVEESMAILDAELEDFEHRPHEKPSLQAKGFRQYYIANQNLNETFGEEQREVKGTKRQQCTMEEFGNIKDMIGKEAPVGAVPGRLKEGATTRKGRSSQRRRKRRRARTTRRSGRRSSTR